MTVNVTWSLLNAGNAENICQYFADNKFIINNHTNFVDNPKELHVKNHPLKKELIERFQDSKFKTVREVASEMKEEYDELQFFKAVAYIKDLDKIRNTQSWKIFPELSKWLK
jgi:glucan phosphorylase